jgi:hypothetical protein
MIYGVAGFHSQGLEFSDRFFKGFGIIEAQKLGCMMRGRDMQRKCGIEGASSA